MSDREERIGYWVSGAAHVALILWALIGGVLLRPQPSQPVRMTEVATMSGSEFEELAAASRGAGPVSEEATEIGAIEQPEAEENAGAPPSETEIPEAPEEAQELAAPEEAESEPDLSDFEPREPVNVATALPDAPSSPEIDQQQPVAPSSTEQPEAAEQPARPETPDQDQAAEPVEPRSPLALDSTQRPLDRPEGLVERYNERLAEQEAARQAAQQAAAEASREAARQAAEAEAAAQAEAERAEQERQEAAAAARAEEEARRAAQERREAEEREAEERRAAEEAARAEAERRAEQERQEAEQRAEEERRAAEEAEQRAAEQAAQEEERRAEQAAREAEEREAADRQALQDALREAQETENGGESAATETTGDQLGGNSQRIEGGSDASVEQDPLSAALSDAMSGAEPPPPEEAEEETAPDPNQLVPQPINPEPLPDPEEQSAVDSETTGAAPLGQPLSLSERETFRVSLERCWNRGALSIEASRLDVSVRFQLGPNGKPDMNSPELIEASDASPAAVRNAYEVARRAILRCGAAGFPLPAEKYGRWREVIVDFRPEGIDF